MFGWIPVIGPIIQGIVGIFGKWQDTVLGKYTIDGKVDVEAMQASEAIIATTRDDIGIRLARDLLLFPVIIWTDLIVWDKIMVIEYPNLVFSVASLPDAIAYLPYAAATFLLGAVGMTLWSRK
jgi:hypothetical protein